MLDADRERAARAAAFEWLDAKFATGQSELSRTELESFEFEGEQLKLIDQSRGIRNPRQFAATLSVMTGANSPYADEPVAGGLVRYDYRAGDGGDNGKLRRAAELRMPIIYFRSIRPAAFIADYPVYVTDMPEERAVLLAIGDDLHAFGDPSSMNDVQRSYAERITRQRLHQPLFRAKVMYAYERRCAVCSLKHADLLDAAHIIPDHHDAGAPVVSNGVALCKIHHAAYDRNFLGLSPDYVLHINRELMLEVDGPMLKYGIRPWTSSGLRSLRARASVRIATSSQSGLRSSSAACGRSQHAPPVTMRQYRLTLGKPGQEDMLELLEQRGDRFRARHAARPQPSHPQPTGDRVPHNEPDFVGYWVPSRHVPARSDPNRDDVCTYVQGPTGPARRSRMG